MALLEIKDLSVFYEQAIAIEHISLQVDKEACVGIIGPNGAGKTTLLRSISGLKNWEGEIRFAGKSLHKKTSAEIVKAGIVQAPEGRHLFPQLSVAENLELGAFLLRSRQAVKENLGYVMALFPILQERRRQMAGTLSGGEQQMLSIGRALMASPQMLLLDEPSFGLAPLIKDVICESIQQVRQRGVTIVLVEQDAQMAFNLSQHVYVLEEGHIAMHGDSLEIAADPGIKRAYLGLE